MTGAPRYRAHADSPLFDYTTPLHLYVGHHGKAHRYDRLRERSWTFPCRRLSRQTHHSTAHSSKSVDPSFRRRACRGEYTTHQQLLTKCYAELSTTVQSARSKCRNAWSNKKIQGHELCSTRERCMPHSKDVQTMKYLCRPLQSMKHLHKIVSSHTEQRIASYDAHRQFDHLPELLPRKNR